MTKFTYPRVTHLPARVNGGSEVTFVRFHVSRSRVFALALLCAAIAVLAAACAPARTPTLSECQRAEGGRLVNSDCVAPGVTPDPTATPTPPSTTPTGGTVSGPQLFVSSGCAACHTIDSVAQARGTIGPNISKIGERPEAYIREAILTPNAVIAPACPGGPCPRDVMPGNFGQLLRPAEIDALVQFLASLK